MSIFKFSHKINTAPYLIGEASVFYLNESRARVQEEQARRFAVKVKTKDGFSEFFGKINNSKFDTEILHPKPNLPFLDEESSDVYTLYGLNEDKVLSFKDKQVPIYIPREFLQIAPRKFAGRDRTVDQLAQAANARRNRVYEYYSNHMHNIHIKSLSEVNCNSVAYLYSYLNNGEKWKEGMEYYGFVDGLWETGSFLTVSIDTYQWDLHTAVHEVGHSVSYFLINELFTEWIHIAGDMNEEPPSDYGKTEISEDFAESYAFYFMNGAEREHLKEVCPRRFDYMERIDKIGESVLVKELVASASLSKRFRMLDKVIYK